MKNQEYGRNTVHGLCGSLDHEYNATLEPLIGRLGTGRSRYTHSLGRVMVCCYCRQSRSQCGESPNEKRVAASVAHCLDLITAHVWEGGGRLVAYVEEERLHYWRGLILIQNS